MAFKLGGRFIALSNEMTVASNDPQKPPMKKRELYMDCTKFDGLTGEQIGKENKVLLEFGGEKVLDKMVALNLQKGDVIIVDFDIQGTQYNDKNTGKMRVFTAIRCFDIMLKRRAGEPITLQSAPAQAPQQAPQQAQAPQPVQQPVPQPEPAPAAQNDAVFGEAPQNDGLPF